MCKYKTNKNVENDVIELLRSMSYKTRTVGMVFIEEGGEISPINTAVRRTSRKFTYRPKDIYDGVSQ